MAKTRDIVIGVIIGGSFLIFFAIMIGIFVIGGRLGSDDYSVSGFGEKVAIVNLYGVIESSSDIVRQLDRWGKDSHVKAIVLHIDSPGGGVAASQEIYEKVKKVRQETKKPIIVSMGSVCASGGYYVACAADKIVANPGSVTGSIGVIFQWPVAEKLMEKIGLQFETIKSGKRKDVGSTWREANDSDKVMLQRVVDDTYNQFVDALVSNRPMSRDDVLRIADGSVFTGKQAQSLGMVDSLGTFDDAVDLAGELCGIGKDPDRVKELPRRQNIFDLIGSISHVDLAGLLDKGKSEIYPKLSYLFN